MRTKEYPTMCFLGGVYDGYTSAMGKEPWGVSIRWDSRRQLLQAQIVDENQYFYDKFVTSIMLRDAASAYELGVVVGTSAANEIMPGELQGSWSWGSWKEGGSDG